MSLFGEKCGKIQLRLAANYCSFKSPNKNLVSVGEAEPSGSEALWRSLKQTADGSISLECKAQHGPTNRQRTAAALTSDSLSHHHSTKGQTEADAVELVHFLFTLQYFMCIFTIQLKMLQKTLMFLSFSHVLYLWGTISKTRPPAGSCLWW